MSQFCTNCGQPLPDDAKFCEACGAKVEPEYYEEVDDVQQYSEEAPSAPQPAPAAPHPEPRKAESPAYETRKPSGPAYPGTGAPSGPPKSGGGIPKVAIIGGVVLIAAAAGVFILRGGKPDGGKAESENVQTETLADAQTTAPVSSPAGGSTSGLTAAEQAALLDAGLDAISGGVTAADAAVIKVPEGAQVKTDADFMDLIGEYEGEIQMTTIDGFEKIDGIPSNFESVRQNALSSPLPCSLEIEENGQWMIKWTLLGSMTFESRDFDDPEEVTPAQIDALMITRPNNGMYHSKLNISGDDGSGGQANMAMDHVGAYCTDGDDRMIAGNFLMAAQMYGADIMLQGDFLVHKTTEDFAAEEKAAIAGNTAQTEPEEEETEAAASVTESAPPSGNGSSGGVGTDALGRKAEALAKKNDKNGSVSQGLTAPDDEIKTVSGGKWIQIASVWFYEKNGELVKNSWIDDNGVYYYVDETGYMLSNAYTPDGYYVGADGSYDPNAPQNKDSSSAVGKYEGTTTGEALAAIAKKLSTDEIAYATEFDWFIDYVENRGSGGGQVITDPNLSSQIKDLQPALNGGWKAFIFTESGVYGSDVERYLNANIEASGGKFNIRLNWKYLWDPATGGTIEETGSSMYRGTYDDVSGTATAMADDSKIDFDGFWLSADGNTEYAVGTFYWISGEKDRIALMRSAH